MGTSTGLAATIIRLAITGLAAAPISTTPALHLPSSDTGWPETCF
jgi:hypothetical protein